MVCPVGATFSRGVARFADGVFSSGVVGAAAGVTWLDAAPSPGVVGVGAGGDMSVLPRMTGKPFLPPPMTTTFEFVDCAS